MGPNDVLFSADVFDFPKNYEVMVAALGAYSNPS